MLAYCTMRMKKATPAGMALFISPRTLNGLPRKSLPASEGASPFNWLPHFGGPQINRTPGRTGGETGSRADYGRESATIKALAAGERGITVHPHDDEKGTSV